MFQPLQFPTRNRFIAYSSVLKTETPASTQNRSDHNFANYNIFANSVAPDTLFSAHKYVLNLIPIRNYESLYTYAVRGLAGRKAFASSIGSRQQRRCPTMCTSSYLGVAMLLCYTVRRRRTRLPLHTHYCLEKALRQQLYETP